MSSLLLGYNHGEESFPKPFTDEKTCYERSSQASENLVPMLLLDSVERYLHHFFYFLHVLIKIR
jgi:hypothetical protein